MPLRAGYAGKAKRSDPSQVMHHGRPIVCTYPCVVWCDPAPKSDGVRLQIKNDVEGVQTFAVLTPAEAMRLMADLAKSVQQVLAK